MEKLNSFKKIISFMENENALEKFSFPKKSYLISWNMFSEYLNVRIRHKNDKKMEFILFFASHINLINSRVYEKRFKIRTARYSIGTLRITHSPICSFIQLQIFHWIVY